MTRVVKIIPHARQELTYFAYIVNVMGADVLATQGARASATSILIFLNQNNSIPGQ